MVEQQIHNHNMQLIELENKFKKKNIYIILYLYYKYGKYPKFRSSCRICARTSS